MEITDWVLIRLSLSISFGTEEDWVRTSLRLRLYLCIAYVRPVFVQTCPNADSTRSQRGGVIKIVIIISHQFDSNFLKGAVTLNIWLQTEQKMGERQKERQKDKDEDTIAQWQWQNTAQVVFWKNLWCLTSTKYWRKKISGVWHKHHRFWQICGVWKNLWCLAQTPQILIKFHRIWVDDLGGEWCYERNKTVKWVWTTLH